MLEIERRRQEIAGCTFAPKLSPGTKKLARAHWQRQQEQARAATAPPPPPPPDDPALDGYTGTHRHRGAAAFGSHVGTGRAARGARAASTWAKDAPLSARQGASGATPTDKGPASPRASAYGRKAAAGVTNAKARQVTSRLYDGHYHRDRNRRLAAAHAANEAAALAECTFSPKTHAAPERSRALRKVLARSPADRALELKKKSILLSSTPTKPVGFGSGVSRRLHARGWQPNEAAKAAKAAQARARQSRMPGSRTGASAQRGSFFGSFPGGKKHPGARDKHVAGSDRHGAAFGSTATTARPARPQARSVWTSERGGNGGNGGGNGGNGGNGGKGGKGGNGGNYSSKHTSSGTGGAHAVPPREWRDDPGAPRGHRDTVAARQGDHRGDAGATRPQSPLQREMRQLREAVTLDRSHLSREADEGAPAGPPAGLEHIKPKYSHVFINGRFPAIRPFD